MGAIANLGSLSAVQVRQTKEMLEVFTGFETRNKYKVTDDNGELLFLAYEEGRGWLMRNFLNTKRPFTIQFIREGTVLATVERPWRWFYDEVSLLDASGQLIGTIAQQSLWPLRRFSIEVVGQRSGSLTLAGSLFSPWTFRILKGDQQVGEIKKKWKGLLKEAFTDADNFRLEFPQGAPVEVRAVLVAAVFLLDFLYFEKKQN